MLSEVFTPADLQESGGSDPGIRKPAFDRSVLSAMGSAIPSPQEEIELRYPGRQIDHALSSPGPAVLPTVGELPISRVLNRPRMSRTSTSGTQIFTPNEDGVEVDGMPVGPARDLWKAKESRKEHTYL